MVKQPSKRSIVLAQIRYAGYHNDQKDLIRLYVENRVSYDVARQEFQKGQQARDRGVPCHCPSCSEKGAPK